MTLLEVLEISAKVLFKALLGSSFPTEDDLEDVKQVIFAEDQIVANEVFVLNS